MEVIALRIRQFLCNYLPGIAKFWYSFHKGSCNNCGDCCKTIDWTCEHLVDNICKIHKTKPLDCKVTPLPLDLMFNKKFINCGIHYKRNNGKTK